jgi:hypothetical protein
LDFHSASHLPTLLGTAWNTSDIWRRRELTLGSDELRDAQIQMRHEGADVYLNGVQAT